MFVDDTRLGPEVLKPLSNNLTLVSWEQLLQIVICINHAHVVGCRLTSEAENHAP